MWPLAGGRSRAGVGTKIPLVGGSRSGVVGGEGLGGAATDFSPDRKISLRYETNGFGYHVTVDRAAAAGARGAPAVLRGGRDGAGIVAAAGGPGDVGPAAARFALPLVADSAAVAAARCGGRDVGRIVRAAICLVAADRAGIGDVVATAHGHIAQAYRTTAIAPAGRYGVAAGGQVGKGVAAGVVVHFGVGTAVQAELDTGPGGTIGEGERDAAVVAAAACGAGAQRSRRGVVEREALGRASRTAGIVSIELYGYGAVGVLSGRHVEGDRMWTNPRHDRRRSGGPKIPDVGDTRLRAVHYESLGFAVANGARLGKCGRIRLPRGFDYYVAVRKARTTRTAGAPPVLSGLADRRWVVRGCGSSADVGPVAARRARLPLVRERARAAGGGRIAADRGRVVAAALRLEARNAARIGYAAGDRLGDHVGVEVRITATRARTAPVLHGLADRRRIDVQAAGDVGPAAAGAGTRLPLVVYGTAAAGGICSAGDCRGIVAATFRLVAGNAARAAYIGGTTYRYGSCSSLVASFVGRFERDGFGPVAAKCYTVRPLAGGRGGRGTSAERPDVVAAAQTGNIRCTEADRLSGAGFGLVLIDRQVRAARAHTFDVEGDRTAENVGLAFLAVRFYRFY